MRLWAVMLAGMALCAQEKQPDRGINFYSREKEARFGAVLAEGVRKNSTTLDCAAARNHVAMLGR